MSLFGTIDFPCKEKGCNGRVKDGPLFVVRVQTGCCSSGAAICCPLCGRMHWRSSGIPVRNRRCENAYYIEGRIVHRPMPAEEKKVFIQNYLDHAGSSTEKELLDVIRDEFQFLIEMGHASGCKKEDPKNGENCTCGNKEAEEWIKEHPAQEEVLVE